MKHIGRGFVTFGIIIGLSISIYLSYFNGILYISDMFWSNAVNGIDIKVGTAKILFSGLIGFIFYCIFSIPGYFLTEK